MRYFFKMLVLKVTFTFLLELTERCFGSFQLFVKNQTFNHKCQWFEASSYQTSNLRQKWLKLSKKASISCTKSTKKSLKQRLQRCQKWTHWYQIKTTKKVFLMFQDALFLSNGSCECCFYSSSRTKWIMFGRFKFFLKN